MWPTLILVVLIVAFFVYRQLTQLSPAEAKRLVGEGARLIDVRSPAEFAGGALPGAVNVPVNELEARLDALGPKDQPKVLYCASGMRSAVAKATLKRHGFTQVHNLGAMSRW
ncbi:MAG: rhodanese-like domain-containing protein [Myxococcaceae bacterium]|nr:rhodanese-like domain-containing protein [Myxococcaceae bacterium]